MNRIGPLLTLNVHEQLLTAARQLEHEKIHYERDLEEYRATLTYGT